MNIQTIKQTLIIILIGFSFSQDYDYSLQDTNPNSDINGTFIGPSYFEDKITINYFGWESWGGWRQIFTQLCDLNDSGAWDTDKVVLIGIGIGAGSVSSWNVTGPWVQDFTMGVWNQFLEGTDGARKKVVLVDTNLERRYIGVYSGASITNSQLNELYAQIQILIDEMVSSVPGDINADGELNVVDVISVVNLILAGEYNELADINNDNALNVTDVISMVNLILSN